MEQITIYDSYNRPLSPSEITLRQIFDYEMVIINGSVFRNTDTLDSLGNGDAMTLLGVYSIEYYNKRSIRDLRDDFSEVINDARENEDIVILLGEGTDTKFPHICANGLIDRRTFWNTIKALNELREHDQHDQECEGTFKVQDGKVTEIDITGIALIPRFRDKNSDKE